VVHRIVASRLAFFVYFPAAIIETLLNGARPEKFPFLVAPACLLSHFTQFKLRRIARLPG
jgi:hypothetical protein